MRTGLLGALLGLACVNAQAAFESASTSIKAEALGGAFVALGDDSTTLFVNPAGLARLEQAEASMMYSKPLAGLDGINLSSGHLAAAVPINSQWGLGAGLTTFRAAGLLSEYQATVGGAWRGVSWLSVGAAVSYLRHSYELSSDPAYAGEDVFAGGNAKGAMSAHMGLLAEPAPNWQAGFSVRNLNEPDVGLRYNDPVQREIRLGSLYRFSRVNFLAEVERDDSAAGATNVWKLGVEIPVRAVSLRAGVNSNAFTLGAGIRLGAFGVDYAFSLLRDLTASNYGNQLLALSYRFGEPRESQSPNTQKRDRRQLWVW